MSNPPAVKVATVGSRTLSDKKHYSTIKSHMNQIFPNPSAMISLLVSGGAIGPDQFGEQYAKEYKIPLSKKLPDWNKHGRGAGMIRNTEIVESSDVIVAFWDGVSNGTHDTLNKAKRLNKKVYCFTIVP
jgi:hypothetical protein